MSVKNSEIAQRIKEIRELSNISEGALAECINLSADDYLEIESGKAEIPVSVLFDICGVLKISMTELLTGVEAKLHSYSLVKKGRGLDVDRASGYKYKDLAYPFKNRQVEPLLVTIVPYEEEIKKYLHSHNGQEFHYYLEGKADVTIGEHIVRVEAGDSLYFDSRQPHGMKAVDCEKAVFLVVVV